MSDQLFELIRSLTGAEKGYFKKYCSLYTSERDNIYLQLFNEIDSHKQYDEQAILERFKKEKIAKELAVAKSYLKKIILKSLRLYHSNSDPYIKYAELMANVIILHKKKLYNHRNKELKMAKKIVAEYELFELIPEITKWEFEMLNEKTNLKSIKKEIFRIANQNSKGIKKITTLYGLIFLSYPIYSHANAMGFNRSAKKLKQFMALTEHDILKYEKLIDSTRAKAVFYNVNTKISETLNDPKGTYKYGKKLYELLIKNPALVKTNFEALIVSNYNLMLDCISLIKEKEFYNHLNSFRDIPNKYEKLCPGQDVDRIIVYALHAELLMQVTLANFDKAKRVAEQIEKTLKTDLGKLFPLMYLEMYYSISYTYFALANFDRAIEWANKIINYPTIAMREDIFAYARILSLFSHYELKDMETLEYQLKSTTRYLSKRNRSFKFEQALLQFLSLQLKQASNTTDGQYADFRRILIEIKKNPYEKVAFGYFDIIAWADSKLTRKPFKEMVNRK